MIRVFIADDHAIVRSSLQLLLEATEQMIVVGTAEDGLRAVQAPEIDRCDVVILDLSLPKLSGGEVLRRLRARRPELPVVILSMFPEDQYAPSLLRDGAAAYVSKHRPPEDVIAVIRQVARDAGADAGSLPPRPAAAAEPPPHARLSPREHEVLLLLARGRSLADIATELNLRPSVVSDHLQRIKEQLAVGTLAEVIGYARRVGLLG